MEGYEYFEVLSAFQKAVRRGLEEDALYWAGVLYRAGKEGSVWARLMVIACEDVGLADPSLALHVWGLYQISQFLGKRGSAIALTQAVLMAVRAPKSRLCDHAMIAFIENAPKERKEVPDYALDMHTRRGKLLGRGIDHFFKDGSKLANEAGIFDPYEEVAKEILKEKEASKPGEDSLVARGLWPGE